MTYRTPTHLVATILLTMLAAAASERTVMAREKHRPTEKETPTTTSPLGESITTSDYKDLVYRNLFSREQRKRRSDPSRDAPADHETALEAARTREKASEASNKGETDIVLMGIVDKDNIASAFLEDRRAGKTLTVKSGDTIAGGKVGKISVNAMEYIVGEKTTTVAFGSNLQGGVSSAKPLDTSGGGTDPKSTGDVKGGAAVADDPNASIIEKLRRKRLKEMNR